MPKDFNFYSIVNGVISVIICLLDEDAVENQKYYGVSVGYLQSRLKNLEDENRSLRGEANRLAMETDEVEAKEAQLMSDFASQLSVTRSDLSVIMEQADKHRDENVTLHNNCEFLRSKLSSIETSLKIVCNPISIHSQIMSQTQFSSANPNQNI